MQDHPTYKLPTCTNGCMYLDPLADSILTFLDQGRIWGHSLRALQITKNWAVFIIYRLISYKRNRICNHCVQKACWGWRQKAWELKWPWDLREGQMVVTQQPLMFLSCASYKDLTFCQKSCSVSWDVREIIMFIKPSITKCSVQPLSTWRYVRVSSGIC